MNLNQKDIIKRIEQQEGSMAKGSTSSSKERGPQQFVQRFFRKRKAPQDPFQKLIQAYRKRQTKKGTYREEINLTEEEEEPTNGNVVVNNGDDVIVIDNVQPVAPSTSSQPEEKPLDHDRYVVVWSELHGKPFYYNITTQTGSFDRLSTRIQKSN